MTAILVSLSACAPYRQAGYYPAGGGYNSYSSGYGVTQRSYYGGYPSYPGNSYSYPSSNNYYYYDNDNGNRHNHNYNHGYNIRPSGNTGYVRPNPTQDSSHYHPDRKHRQTGYPSQNRDRGDYRNDRRNLPASDRPRENTSPYSGRQNRPEQNYGQNRRPGDRRDHDHGPRQNEWEAKNQIKEQRNSKKERNERVRYGKRKQDKSPDEISNRDRNPRFGSN